MKTTETMIIKNGDAEFTLLLTQLRPSRAIKVITYLSRILGSTAGKALGSVNGFKPEDLENASLEKLGDAITHFLVSIDDDAFIEKINILFESVTHNNTVIHVDYPCFQGRPDLILSVAKKALEVNFKDFLQENSALVGKFTKSLKIIRGEAQ